MKTHLLNRVENIASRGEIACFEQFLLLSQCFQKISAAEMSESVYMRERVKYIIFTFYFVQMIFDVSVLRNRDTTENELFQLFK